MTENSTATDRRTTEQDATAGASLHVMLSYRDAPAALRWLERVFGFETMMEVPDDRGGLAHAELRYGDRLTFAVFSDHSAYNRPARKGDTAGWGLYVAAGSQPDVDRFHAAAVEAGAEVIWAPELSEWGNYRCRIVDPEGYEWTFATYVPGMPQDYS